MDIDSKKLKDAIVFMFDNYKNLETELLAYRFVVKCLQESGIVTPDIPWDQALEKARREPLILAYLEGKYGPLVDDVLKAIDQAVSSQELAELLKKWTPSGLPN
jgi:hypothetical protein